ncbi:hypothetical protein BDR07DRAFT_185005 [Suillus spraguei]|nr:hypothetical protein BDR07DRAFT_185005 [Suillus spraguei]
MIAQVRVTRAARSMSCQRRVKTAHLARFQLETHQFRYASRPWRLAALLSRVISCHILSGSRILALVRTRIATISSSLFRGLLRFPNVPIAFDSTYIMGH